MGRNEPPTGPYAAPRKSANVLAAHAKGGAEFILRDLLHLAERTNTRSNLGVEFGGCAGGNHKQAHNASILFWLVRRPPIRSPPEPRSPRTMPSKGAGFPADRPCPADARRVAQRRFARIPLPSRVADLETAASLFALARRLDPSTVYTSAGCEQQSRLAVR